LSAYQFSTGKRNVVVAADVKPWNGSRRECGDHSIGRKHRVPWPSAECCRRELDRNGLLAHQSPGNVRELHNALERAAILAQGGIIGPRRLSLHTAVLPLVPSTDLGNLERRTIAEVLRETDGNKTRAARRLGITRTELFERLRKYGLDAPSL
jgi:transcriptional regulator with AAA-type ATPase domain